MGTYHEFLATQTGIYAKFEVGHRSIAEGEATIAADPGADNKGAFLVAWRYPERVAEEVQEVSLGVNGIVRAVTYGPDNLHSTLSDHGLQPGLVINTENPDHKATLDTLSDSVRRGLATAGATALRDIGINLTHYATNPTTVIATGVPTEAVYNINQATLAASADLGIVNAKGNPGLGGSWGAHATVARYAESADTQTGLRVVNYLDEQTGPGEVAPTSIDVGHFYVSPDRGFDFTVHESFSLVRD